MKYRQHNAARDANEKDVVRVLRERGAVVVRLSQPVDLLVGWHGVWTLVEVKSHPKAKIQKSQQAFADQCREAGTPLIFLYGVQDIDYWFPVEPQNVGTGEKNCELVAAEYTGPCAPE